MAPAHAPSKQVPGAQSSAESPHFQVLELQHWRGVPRQVAFLFWGPHFPSEARRGCLTRWCLSVVMKPWWKSLLTSADAVRSAGLQVGTVGGDRGVQNEESLDCDAIPKCQLGTGIVVHSFRSANCRLIAAFDGSNRFRGLTLPGPRLAIVCDNLNREDGAPNDEGRQRQHFLVFFPWILRRWTAIKLRGMVASTVLFSVPLTPLFCRADTLSVCLVA